VIPYPGESLGIFQNWAAVGDNYSLGVSYRAGSSTLAAGDEWRVWVAQGSTTYLDAPGDCDGSPAWVVVVDSGTATVTASEGPDAAYGDTTAAHPTALGTFTLTPGDNVIPSTFTVADVWGGSTSMMLVLEASSGSAVVSQVKLRLWPSTGAAGGWSDLQPSWETTATSAQKQYGSQTYSGGADDADPAASWSAAVAAFHGDYSANSGAASRGFGSVPTTPSAGQGMSQDTLGVYSSSSDLTAALVMLTGRDWRDVFPIQSGLVDGVDWIRPPDEVDGDTAAVAQQVGSGSTGWTDATITLTEGDGMPGTVTLYTEGGEWANDAPGSGTYYTTTAPAGASGAGTFALATTGLMSLAVVAHSMAAGDADTYPGWAPNTITPDSRSDEIGYTLGPVKSYAVMPPYRVWSPSAAALPKVRQLHRDDGRGIAPRRHFGGSSRANTGRHFGYD
jgi:hypothetical protein